VATAGERPAKTVNDAGHGIEAVDPAPTLRNERTGVGDRRSEHPELENERDNVFDVAIEGIERGEPEADAKSGENGEEQEKRKERSGCAGLHAVKQRDTDEDDKADGEIDESGKDGGEREDEAREIDFGDHALIFNDDIGRLLERVIEIRPGDERDEIKNGIGQALRRKLGEASEEKSEDKHGEKRLKDDPQDTDGGLFIADFNVAPDEEIKEFAVGPEFGEAEIEQAAWRFDASHDGKVARCWGDRGTGRRRRQGHHQERLLPKEREKNIVLGYQRKRVEERWRPGQHRRGRTKAGCVKTQFFSAKPQDVANQNLTLLDL